MSISLNSSLVVRLAKVLFNRLGLLNMTAADTKKDQRCRAIEQLALRNWTLPLDYKFDRDEANER
jgi:antitoxin MazE